MAAGRLQVEELAEELDEDCSWLEAQQQQQQQIAAPLDGSSSKEAAAAAAAAAAGEAAGWSIPPESVSSRRWSRALPVMLQVNYIVLTLRPGPPIVGFCFCKASLDLLPICSTVAEVML